MSAKRLSRVHDDIISMRKWELLVAVESLRYSPRKTHHVSSLSARDCR